jgi:hypothetical protein
MNKDNLVKTAALVFVSILAGAIISVGIQHLGSGKHHHKQGQKIASAESTVSADQSPNEAADESDLATSNESAAVSSKIPPAGTAPNPALESAHPVSEALSILNGPAASIVPQAQEATLAPGLHYSESSSGYPIYTGWRAVDSPMAALPSDSSQTQTVIYGQDVSNLQPQQIGRNGLLANPCVDPGSAHGLAYSRHAN